MAGRSKPPEILFPECWGTHAKFAILQSIAVNTRLPEILRHRPRHQIQDRNGGGRQGRLVCVPDVPLGCRKKRERDMAVTNNWDYWPAVPSP